MLTFFVVHLSFFIIFVGMIQCSFSPIEDQEIEVLVLGSFPSVKSLQDQEYYAFPRNRFWQVVAGLTQSALLTDYTQKKAHLLRNHIGVWDVAHQAVRKGSADVNIREVVPHPIEAFLREHPKVRLIAFNGRKSEELFYRFFKPQEGMRYVALPSTSPANAAYSLVRLLEAWSVLLGE